MRIDSNHESQEFSDLGCQISDLRCLRSQSQSSDGLVGHGHVGLLKTESLRRLGTDELNTGARRQGMARLVHHGTTWPCHPGTTRPATPRVHPAGPPVPASCSRYVWCHERRPPGSKRALRNSQKAPEFNLTRTICLLAAF